ncbi:ABC transporter permease subunit [Rhodococcus oryzae]|uniref:ABC transporter permease subunit n=1 Tax=Rhodococcus oryzae TaxID=2571143 RepID=UPI0037A2B4B6
MFRSVLTKTLHDQRRALPAWVIGLVLLVGMYVAIWPSVRGEPSMNEFLDQMPEAFRALFAMSGADMSTPIGYVKIELLSFMVPLLLLTYAIGAGAAAIAGEEDRRTLDLLLSAPISRRRIVLEKSAAMLIGTALLGTVTGLALILLGSLANMDLPHKGVAAAMVHAALLALVFGALALALGAITGHPAVSRSVPVAAAVLAYIVNGLAPVVTWLEPWQRTSPFFQYAGHDPIQHGLSASSAVIALATVAVLIIIAIVGFDRRDVRG